MKLGKLAPQFRPETPHFANYLLSPPALLPTVPDDVDWIADLPEDLGMFANDRYGDCAFVAQAHAELTWAAGRGECLAISDDDVLGAYSGCTGFKQNDPTTDRGTVLADALVHWAGPGIGGRRIAGHVLVDHRNILHVRAAAYLFGGVYLGAALPISAQDTSKPWTGKTGALVGNDAPGSWGGHCVWCPKEALISGATFITWSRRQGSDWQWWLNYVDECYAPLSQDWADAARKAPNGFDFKALQADLPAVAA